MAGGFDLDRLRRGGDIRPGLPGRHARITDFKAPFGGDLIAEVIGAAVKSGDLAGAVTLVWRDCALVQTCAVGRRDIEADLPMTRDTLFRIAGNKTGPCSAPIDLNQSCATSIPKKYRTLPV